MEFDGWRVQLHKTTRADAIYTKSGYHCIRRFKSLASAVADLSVLSCLIDGEATARDEQGLPDFPMLQFRNAEALKRCSCGPLIFSPSTAMICAVVHCLIASTGSNSSCSLAWGRGPPSSRSPYPALRCRPAATSVHASAL